MAPKHSAGVLCGVPKGKKAVLCLTEKLQVLGKLPSGMSCSAAGREFNVNELTLSAYESVHVNRNTHKTKLFIG